MSFLLSIGMMISRLPARYAANDFSFNPPIGKTFPRKVISPVIAISRLTARFVSAETIAVTRGGVAVGLLSIPQKNMHTGVEVVDLADVAHTGQLLAAYICAGGKEA